MPGLPAPLGVEEMIRQRLRIGLGEAEPLEPRENLFGPQLRPERLEALLGRLHRVGDLQNRLSRSAGRIGGDQRLAPVARFAEANVERHATEQRQVELTGQSFPSARAEDLELMFSITPSSRIWSSGP